MSRKILCVLSAMIALLVSATARAGLLGTSVTGDFSVDGGPNFFDPTNGFVPAGYGNSAPGNTTVTIAEPLIEFGFADVPYSLTANFTDNTLTISDQVHTTFIAQESFTFIDTAFTGDTLSKLSDTFPQVGTSGTLVGDVITISFDEEVFSGQTYSATYTIASAGSGASVPLPWSAWASFLSAATAFAFRRKLLTA